MENFAILGGILVWGPVILVWVFCLMKGKLSKPIRIIGSFFIFGLPLLGAIGMFAGDRGESQYYPFYLQMSVQSRDASSVAFYLGKGVDPNAADDSADGPLLTEAAANGDEEIVRLLLAHHANVNAVNPQNHRTALSTAYQHGYKKIATLLKQAGATP